MDSVYVALVEVSPLPGGILDSTSIAGAIVRCYALASDSGAAEQRIRQTLKADGLTVIEVEWCVNHDDTEWENPEDPDAAACVASARASNDVTYSEFHAWGHDP